MGRVAPLGRNSPLPILGLRHPRAPHRLRSYQLPKHWGVPSLATPPQCKRGVLAPRVPFRGSPVPSTLPPWHTAPRAPHQRVNRSHYAIPAPHGPLAYCGRLARCTHSAILTVRSHAPSPSTGLLHPSKMGSSLHSHQQQNDFHFVNLTNPLTHLIPTPWSLGRESLLPPITHRTMHSTFTPFTQTRWPHSLNVYISLSTLQHSSLNSAILLLLIPYLTRAPTSSLTLVAHPFTLRS